ncbi:YkgJ family cysteine cluster protein [Methanomethylovorans sp.]|uniref:YkgJ family cysteine cluster protein n=1 Tax=Methanomethylovorans sp. TaxID=2758717 RepID=UPI00345E8CF8
MELVIVAKSSIEEQILDLRKELHDLLEFPIEKLCEIIKEVGFECDMCSKCCTSDFNDHIFILDQEVPRIRNLPSDALEPAPYFEFCDNTGTFYVSGYALRTKEDGSCIFLEGGRCNIYEHRPLICKLYPYMLHREADHCGKMDWRQISGLNEHGVYHSEITDEECIRIANLTIDYETAYLEHQICFLEKVNEHFKKQNLKHIQSIYDRMMRKLSKGEKVRVMVYCNGRFEKHYL